MKIQIPTTIEREVLTARLYLKLRDEFYCTFHGTKVLDQINSDSYVVAEYEGYVPNSVFPGEYGDYLDLIIDLETGQILNWRKPKPYDIEKILSEKEEE